MMWLWSFVIRYWVAATTSFAYSSFVIPHVSAQGVSLGELRQEGQVSTFREFIGALYTWGARLGVALAIVMTVWAGYLYMTSTGNPDQINRAKEYLTGAIVGLGLIFLSYLILNTISPALVGGR